MATKIFNRGALDAYIRNLDATRQSRHRRSDRLVATIGSIRMRVDHLEDNISDLMAMVNQMRKRRHNSIGVSWYINPDRVNSSYTQPVGPIWAQLRIGRDGRRHLQRIKKVTLARVKESYQGRDAGELKRLFAQISVLSKERNRLLAAMTRVARALQYVESDLRQNTP